MVNYHKVLNYFDEISKIPRISFCEEEIANYLCSKGHEFGLEVLHDSENNVILKKKAANGAAPGVVLQAHTDMVWETDSEEDITPKIPRGIHIENGVMTADGTTLGADNGIGVALTLALLEEHLESDIGLEALFTSNEEETMGGASALNASQLSGQYLINLDSEQEGVLTIGAAGGISSVCTLPIRKRASCFQHGIWIKIAGGKSGHSGLEIHKKRKNAILLLARLMRHLPEGAWELASIEGGTRSNAIPGQASAHLNTDRPEEIKKAVELFVAQHQNEWQDEEPLLELHADDAAVSELVYEELDCEEILLLLENLPHGVKSQTEEFVCSSVNLALLHEEEQAVCIELSLRSSFASWYHDEVKKIARLAASFGGSAAEKDEYEAWQYQKQSHLLHAAQESYRHLFHRDAMCENVHAGVECGIIMERCPTIREAISLGPTIRYAHTTQEELDVNSVSQVYALLNEILLRLNHEKE